MEVDESGKVNVKANNFQVMFERNTKLKVE